MTTLSSSQAATARRSATFLHSLAFVVGFGVVFTLLGTTAGLLGSTLLTAEQMPVKLPAVSMKGVLLPSLGGIGLELGQRYGRALLQQAYQLLTC